MLAAYKPKLAGHTELRLHRNSGRNVLIVSGNVTTNSSSESTGLSARVYNGGYWGFASAAGSDAKDVDGVLDAAARNAAFLTSRLGTYKPDLTALPGGFVTSGLVSRDADQKTLLEFGRELDAYIAKTYPNLTARYVAVRSDFIEKSLVTSDGADSYSLIPRAHVMCQLSAETSDGVIVELYDRLGGGGGFWGELFTSPESLYGKLDALYETLMKKRDGVFTNAGVRDVVLDSELAGILAHEAIGHTTEADLVLGGSVAGAFLGKAVASELVTLVDFANTYEGAECPQPIYVDDEGVIASDARIIENGVLRCFMHNRESAAHFNHAPTGNARAYSFSDEPLIRMRNTAILPGSDKLDAMIASIDDGYYLTHTGNGQADLTSEFMFGVNMGYEIKNGKLGRAIRDTTISGVAFDLLKSVTMVSDEMTWNSSGMCGKKQPMPVGMGGPSIKCKVNIGGR
jgi:TldD protein